MYNKDMDKNKFQKNSRFFTITVYAVVGFLICAVGVRLIFSFSEVWKGLGVVLGVLSPFIIGTILAYLINPLFKFLDFTFLGKWLHMTKKRKLRKALSLLISYIIVLGIVGVMFYVVIPQFVESMSSLVVTVTSFGRTVQGWLADLQEHFKNLNLGFLTDNINNLVPTIGAKIREWAEGIMPQILSTSVGVVSGIVKAVLAVFVSVYILADKQSLENTLRKLYYAFFKVERAQTIARITRESSNIFSNYFTGKIFDSLIIGILCGIGMLILRLPYPLLVSVLVGVTNIIPSFGPFLGAIPSILIMLMTGWKEALIFTIFIIVLQQIDGNLIGPKILGDSTGLSPIWILFAITVGAWVGGVAGMLFGVPVMAVIAHIAEEIVNNRLEAKGLYSMVERDEAPQTMNYSDMVKRIFKRKKKETPKGEEAEIIPAGEATENISEAKDPGQNGKAPELPDSEGSSPEDGKE